MRSLRELPRSLSYGMSFICPRRIQVGIEAPERVSDVFGGPKELPMGMTDMTTIAEMEVNTGSRVCTTGGVF